LAILAYGVMVYQAFEAIQELQKQGYDISLYDGRFAKPVDVLLIKRLVEAGVPILTVEDHALAGGFGSAVLEACNEQRLSADRVYRLAMPARWVYQESRNNQLAEAGIDAAGICRQVRQILDKRAGSTAAKPELKIRTGVGPAKAVR